MVLEKILKAKKGYIEEWKKKAATKTLETAFSHNIISQKNIIDTQDFSVIAEIKRSSPSAGNIRQDIDIGQTAADYQNNGAAGISVLTCEPFFNGCIEDLKNTRKAVCIPILMKDFIIDIWQIYEGRLYGADIVILIMRILNDEDFIRLVQYAESLHLETLIEVHSKKEIERSLKLVKNWDDKILGINNRNLETLTTDLKITADLIKFVEGYKITVISESGIRTAEDVLRIRETGVKGILVGESLLKRGSPGDNLKKLIS